MRTLITSCFLLLSIFLSAQSSSSEFKRISLYNESGFSSDELEKNIPKGKINPNGIAVVIGNKSYQNEVSSVEFASNDATIMYKYLTEMMGFKPENIIYRENAKLSDLKLIFGDKDNHKGRLFNMSNSMSEIFLFYSGHGAPDPNDQNSYIMPIDADPNHLALTGYKLETLYENISRIEHQKATIVIDACFSGSTSNGEEIIKYASPVRIKIKKTTYSNSDNSVIITAAKNNQIASWYPQKKHGLLTYFFLKGLRGEADINRDRKISVDEMTKYLTDRNNGVPGVARSIFSREQDPEIIGLPGFILNDNK